MFDTPGLVGTREMKKHHLENSFVSSQRHSIQHSDFIGVIHDVSNTFTRNQLDKTVLDVLEAYPKVPSFLVLNKIDTLKSKRVLLDLTKTLTQHTLLPRGIERRKAAVANKKDKEQPKDTIKSSDSGGNDNQVVGWPNFSEVFMISALTGDGMTALMVKLTNALNQIQINLTQLPFFIEFHTCSHKDPKLGISSE